MKTKGQIKAVYRRRVRRREKNSDAKFDVMPGRVYRRGYGNGIAK